MTFIFILYAITFIGLGGYTYYKRRDRLTQIFLIFNGGLATWTISILLQEPEYVLFIPVNLVSQVQLIAGPICFNAAFYFCYLYPHPRKSIHSAVNYLNGLLFTTLVYSVLFTEFVTLAVIKGGHVHYIDGVGYTLYGIYEISLYLISVVCLVHSYYKYPTYRGQITYLLVGFGVFLLVGIVTDVVLPIFGEYGYMMIGYFSSALVPICMAYAMLKYELFDIVIVIKQHTARIITLVIVTISFLLVPYEPIFGSHWIGRILITSLGIFWIFYFDKIQVFITTAARRKFVTGGYDEVKLLEQISSILENENNRVTIFEQITQALDKALEVEQYSTLLAARENSDQISYYSISGINHNTNNLPADHPTICYFKDCDLPVTLENTPINLHSFFRTQGYIELKNTLAIPFIANNQLEAIIILGERSTGLGYSDRDIAVIKQIVNNTNPVFYRLTPFEVLEQQFNSAKESLHNAEMQLFESEKMASLGQMVAGVAHELGTPLGCILNASSYLALMINTLEHHDAEFVKNINASTRIIDVNCQKSANLINSFKQVAVDLSHFEIRRFQLHEVLSNITASLRHRMDNFTLHIDHTRDEFTMRSYPGAIDQLITNLINNTILHAYDENNSSGDIRIKTDCRDNNLILTYTDYGKGIPQDEIKKIYEPFYTTKQNKGGTGLGLNIVYNLVTQKLKGSIHCESIVGEYTTFIINIPLSIPDA